MNIRREDFKYRRDDSAPNSAALEIVDFKETLVLCVRRWMGAKEGKGAIRIKDQ
jgi:hypothetical protein